MERGEVAAENEELGLAFYKGALAFELEIATVMRAEIERLRAELLRLQIVSRDKPIPYDPVVPTNPFFPCPGERPWPSWEPPIAPVRY